jgi:hypothetical protein
MSRDYAGTLALAEALANTDLLYIVAVEGDHISAMLIGDIKECPVCTMADALGGILNSESDDPEMPQVLNRFLDLVMDDEGEFCQN